MRKTAMVAILMLVISAVPTTVFVAFVFQIFSLYAQTGNVWVNIVGDRIDFSDGPNGASIDVPTFAELLVSVLVFFVSVVLVAKELPFRIGTRRSQ